MRKIMRFFLELFYALLRMRIPYCFRENLNLKKFNPRYFSISVRGKSHFKNIWYFDGGKVYSRR